MKKILQLLLISALALYLVTRLNSGFTIGGGWSVFGYTTVLLTIINTLLKPLLKILFLPINMITLGLFSWVINIVMLYLLTRIVAEVRIEGWQFVGQPNYFVFLPSFTIHPAMNFVVVSMLLSVIERGLYWLVSK